jgi:Carboxypeptidase regulatory-like domain
MRVVWVVACLVVGVVDAAAQDRRISVRVEDPSGATIPNAQIIVLAGADVIAGQNADGRGLATINVRQAQQLKLVVTAPGFASTEVEVTIPPRVTNHPVTVSMALAAIETDVTVSATEDSAAGGLTETLSQAEIDQLPDDPEELQRMLEEIAGPGATIRVDGFTGGRLPTRDQIARIVVRRDAFSAEFHQVGQGRVEIATRPGVDRWRGNAGLTLRPSGLSAHNAVARSAKAGTLMRVNAFAAGPLVPNRISFSGNIESSSSEDTRGIAAVTPQGPFVAALAQPYDNREVSARTEGLLTKTTLFRASYALSSSERDNQGISELDLPMRGYLRKDTEHELRFSLEGGQRRPYHVRLQFDHSTGAVIPETVAPTIVVQNAFRAGGASTNGQDRNRSVVADTMFTLKARPYTLRVGSLVTWDRNDLGQLRNTLGTFTFTHIAAYEASRPATFTQRVGALPLAFSVTQGATFVQAEFTRRRWNIGVGARYEWQSGIDDRTAIAPRIGVSRPFGRNGRTSLRAGYGWFYGWMPARIEEETRRLAQGSSEEEVIIYDPGYPDPYGQGTQTSQREPPTRLELASSAKLPRWQRTSVGFDHQIRQGLRFNLDGFYERTSNDFRSLDLNAPIDGARPDPLSGRMLLVQSVGRSTRTGFNVDLSFSPRPGMFSSLRYGYSRTFNDADDALTPPATGTFETEYGPSRGDFRHRLNWNVGGPIIWGVTASMNGRLQSGSPYNITTGLDNNGDAIFNDRPIGVGRNTLRGLHTTQTDFRLSWSIPQFRPNGTTVFAQRGPGGQRGSGGPGNRGPSRRFEMYLFVQNAFNRVNYSSYVGVLTSPFFGRPTSAQAARRIELGWRFSF